MSTAAQRQTLALHVVQTLATQALANVVNAAKHRAYRVVKAFDRNQEAV